MESVRVGALSVKPKEVELFTPIFKEVFTDYLVMGMTYEQFWYGPCDLVKNYRDAYRIKKKRENEYLWLQGAYIYDAVGKLHPLFNSLKPQPPQPYLSKPFDLGDDKPEALTENEKEKRMGMAFDMMMNWAMDVNKVRQKKEELTENG